MDTAAPLQLAQVHGRRAIIADGWCRANAPMASVLLDAPVRQRVNDLTERIIPLVLTKPLDLDATHCMDVALARSLECIVTW
jgi:hypothetical protein